MRGELCFDSAIKKIAEEQGISINEVKASIQEAMDAGRKDPDPAVQAVWRSIPSKGEIPTMNEVLSFLACKIVHDAIKAKPWQ